MTPATQMEDLKKLQSILYAQITARDYIEESKFYK